LWVIPGDRVLDYVRTPPGEGPTSLIPQGHTSMKSNLKWYVTRAVLFLGTTALVAGIHVDRSLRW
jgi:hypothetical protein